MWFVTPWRPVGLCPALSPALPCLAVMMLDGRMLLLLALPLARTPRPSRQTPLPRRRTRELRERGWGGSRVTAVRVCVCVRVRTRALAAWNRDGCLGVYELLQSTGINCTRRRPVL